MKLQTLIARYGSTCAYCPAKATTIDHVIPRSRGGRDAITNSRPACWPCNNAKDAMTPLEWLGDACPRELRSFVAVLPPVKPGEPHRPRVPRVRQSPKPKVVRGWVAPGRRREPMTPRNAWYRHLGQ